MDSDIKITLEGELTSNMLNNSVDSVYTANVTINYKGIDYYVKDANGFKTDEYELLDGLLRNH